jgi:hypothetical protein
MMRSAMYRPNAALGEGFIPPGPDANTGTFKVKPDPEDSVTEAQCVVECRTVQVPVVVGGRDS